MSFCYSCKSELNNLNRSEEHIINNSLGGRLKSNNLLCKGCNSLFGETIDKELNNQIGSITDLLNIHRDRDQKKRKVRIELMSEQGNKILVGRGMKPLKSLDIVLDQKTIRLFEEESSYNALRKTKFSELQKKYKVEYDEQIVHTSEKFHIKNTNSTATGNIGFGGNDFFRSIVKISVNYYLYLQLPIAFSKNVIDFVRGDVMNNIAFFYYPSHYEIHKLGINEVSHILHIKGDKQLGILYAYVEIFNTHNVIIIFDDKYVGDNLEYTYAYDLLNNKMMENRKVRIRLGHHFENIKMISRHRNTRAMHERKLHRLEQIIESQQYK